MLRWLWSRRRPASVATTRRSDTRRRLRVQPLESRRLLDGAPVITEFLAANDGSLADGDGASSDWIEIHNQGGDSADLAGWYLTDDPDDLSKWTFPEVPQAELAVDAFLLVFASGHSVADYVDSGGYLHTTFKLDVGGEFLALVDPAGAIESQFGTAAADYPPQRSDVSYGITQTRTVNELVGVGADARMLIPDAPLPTGWTDVGFDASGSPWQEVAMGIGFESPEDPPAPAPGDVDLVVNGNFEANGGGNGSAPTGWTEIVNSYGVWNGIDSVDGGTWVLHAGGSYNAGGRFQDVATVPDEQYELTFWATGFSSGAATQSGVVQVGTPGNNDFSLADNNNAEYVDEQFDVPLHDDPADWVEFSHTFTAQTTTTRLSFQNVYLGAGQSAINVDQVSLVGAVDPPDPPEPGVSESGYVAFDDTRLLYTPPRVAPGTAADADTGWVTLADGADARSSMTGATVDYTFYAQAGSTLELYYRSDADAGGTALVSLDDVAQPPLDTRMPGTSIDLAEDGFRHIIATGLPGGMHAVSVQPQGDGLIAVNGFNLFAPEPVEASLIQNGGFETTTVGTVTGLIDIPVGDSTTVPGWTQGTLPGPGAAVDGHILGVGWLAQEGVHSYHLGGGWANGTVSQTFATEPGARYQLRYWAAGIHGGLPLQRGQVAVADVEAQFFAPALTAANSGTWTEFVFDFVAEEAATTVTFANTGGGVGGTHAVNVDNVGVRLLADANPPIQTDVADAMFGISASALVRIPFEYTEQGLPDGLALQMLYDDGFVAYLNGTEVARTNAPAVLDHTSSAPAERPADEQRAWQSFDLTAHRGLLAPGENVLAVHALNLSADDADFLCSPVLSAWTDGLSTTGYFLQPTPAAPNGFSTAGFVQDTRFDGDPAEYHGRGFYDAPFDVTIASATPGATIVYTTDGSAPTPSNGTQAAPVDESTPPSVAVHVAGTTTLRAAAFKSGYQPTNVDTQTYVFVEDVLTQDGAGLPAVWGPTAADYRLDAEVIGPGDLFAGQFAATIRDDLTALPVVSLVLDADDMFGPAGIYSNATGHGMAWERDVSMEYFQPDGNGDFQIDAGVRIQGNIVRADHNPKRSFRVIFRSDYGDAKLDYPLFGESAVDRFDKIDLRAIYNDSWMQELHPVVTADTGQFVRDRFMQEMHRDMGYLAPRSKFVHLYVNGLYWGMYQATERPDADFAAEHLGGDKDDYDVVKHIKGSGAELVDGNWDAWNQMMAAAAAGPADPVQYAAIGQLLDLEAFADYMLLNAYTGNYDWPHNNWYAARDRTDPEAGFQFFIWDAELIFLSDVNIDRLTPAPPGGPGYLFGQLRQNEQFRSLFADRVHKHLFNDGLLQVDSVSERYRDLLDSIASPIVAESARWGDVRRAFPFTTHDWLAETARILDNYVPVRHDVFLGQARNLGLYPDVDAPTFAIDGVPRHGGLIDAGSVLTMSSATTVTSQDTVVVATNHPSLAFVPTDGSLEPDAASPAWFEPDFDASGWLSGSGGVGYEDEDSVYAGLIDLDVQGAWDAAESSLYTRFDFAVDAEFDSMTLNIEYDDGFVAYLNGTVVASRNAPQTPAWNSLTEGGGQLEPASESIDLTGYLHMLGSGDNLLAIRGLNVGTDSTDMLIRPELVLGHTIAATDAPIYYTTDGTDPRGPDGLPAGERYTAGLPLDGPVHHVTARTFDGGQWSALSESLFVINPAVMGKVVVSEVYYNPPQLDGTFDNNQFEFIELMNVSDQTVYLGGISFDPGDPVEFTFPESDVANLAPGETVLIVKNETAFASRFPGSHNIVGQFADGQLGNGGEWITLRDASGEVIQSFRYDDVSPWPTRADGHGASLQLIAPVSGPDHTDPSSWIGADPTPGSVLGPTIVGRYAFYGGSAFDDGADGAIATDKTALLPGENGTLRNITNYAGGINEIAVDLAQAIDTSAIDVGDLALTVGNNDDPTSWDAASVATLDVLIGAGRGGSDRLVIAWTANAPKNAWLRVAIPVDGNTGLTANDVFYYGNAIGDTGNSPDDLLVSAADVIAIRDSVRGPVGSVPIDDPHDLNRDGYVDAIDVILARNNATGPFSALRLLTPAEPAAPPEDEGESARGVNAHDVLEPLS